MGRLPLLLVLLLLVSLATGAWLLGDSGSAPPVAAANDSDAIESPAGATDASTAFVERDPAAETEAPGDGEQDLERADAEPETGNPIGPRVLVVRGNPPLPVANADVYFITERDGETRAAARNLDLTRFELPIALGQRILTDAEGMARLPPTRAPWFCAAKADADFAFAILPPRNRTVTMLLAPDETITVEVVHATGKAAAGVPVALLQHLPGQKEARPLWQGTAAADGRSIVRHFQLLRENPAEVPADERFLALALVPTTTPAAAEFPGRPALREAVRIELPALGSLRVQLVDHRGTALITSALVGLRLEPNWTSAGPIPVPRQLTTPRANKPLGLAPALLPFVEVGSTLSLFARYANERRPGVLGPLPGPSVPAETKAVDLPVSPRHVVVAGLVLDDAGVPLAVPVAAVLWGDDEEQAAWSLQTLADGHFDFVQSGRGDDSQYLLELRCECAQGVEGEVFTRRLGARVRVPSMRAGERVELGTIRLIELPPLVSGVVVNDLGEPIAEAEVVVQREVPAQPNDPRSRASWRPVALLQTRAAADGSFRIDGPLPKGNLRVRADSNLHFADAVPLHSQGQVVRIKLDRNGILRGRVLLPDWLADGTVSLQLQPFEEAERRSNTRSVDLSRRRGGRFTVEPLRPGRFDARVMVRNVQEPMAVISDVFVVPGETRDGRLRLLDLRQALGRYRLRALDQAGQPLAIDGPIRARLNNSDGSISEAGFRWRNGQAELITGATSAELTFFGRGYRPQTVSVGPGEHDVYLEVLRPVLVEVMGARSLCGPNRRVRVSVLLEGDTGLPASLGGVDQRTGERFSFARWDLGRSSGAWLGNTDLVEIPLMQSGSYEVLLRPHQGNSERTPQASISLGKHQLVIDPSGLNVLRVQVDAAAVMQALQALDQQAEGRRAQPR